MKVISFIFIILLISCNTDRELKHLKQEITKDALIYETGFYPDDKTWLKSKIDHGYLGVANGKYRIKIDTIDWFIRALSPCSTINYEYSISTEVKIQLNDISGIAYAGIIFDYIDKNFYKVLCISNNGTFYLESVINNESTSLIPITIATPINKQPNATNKIELRHKDFKVQILLNDYFIASSAIPKLYAYGQAGLIAGSSVGDYYTPFTGEFDNFILKKIKSKR